LADSKHVSLARSGPTAIARWRELTFRSPNDRIPRFDLGYRLEDRAASETFTPEFIYGRPSLDLSGSFLSGIKLPSADLRHDDLSGADLTGVDLRMADLSGANMTGAHLFRAVMPRANLTAAQLVGSSLGRANLSNTTLRHAALKGADLSYASLSYADLESADLSGADLTAADLSWASLTNANLRGATLTTTSLIMANLTGADLRGARINKSSLESTILHRAIAGGTLFSNCDLRSVIGLETMLHGAPSTIALDTLARSGGRIPRLFLQGAGVAEPLIAAQDVLTAERRTYPSVLLIGSMADSDMAERLCQDLSQAHIPAWALYPDDEDALNTGEASLDHIVYYDRLALLCTDAALENPLTSRYFAELARSAKQGPSAELISLGAGEVFYQRNDRLCKGLREGFALDLRGWEDSTVLGQSLEKLVRELSAPVF
jgi:uncharacterized protein YjbI with pentapeptide repeats